MKVYMVLVLVCLASLQTIVYGRRGGDGGGESFRRGSSLYGPKLQFQLKGETGEEKVTISMDGNEEEFGLKTEWETFSYPRPSNGSFSVKFLNDAINSDVYIRGHESQVADLLPDLNKDWGCGTKNENERCTRLRNGELLWNGTYTYTLKGALEELEAKLTDLEDALANTQTKVAELENCLADISSADCPLPPIGKTGVAGGISGNAAAMADKCDASTCSDIQEEIAKLRPKLNLVVIAGKNLALPEIISPSGVCQGIPRLPDRVIEAQAVYMDNKLMVCGGHKYWEKRNSCQVLGGSSRQWTQGPTMNEARIEFTITKVGRDLYALGGRGEVDSLDSMEKISGSSGEWTKMNQKLPTGRRSHCTVFMETTNSLVVIGGYMWIRDVDAFSISTSTWTQLAPMPVSLMDLGCAVLDQTIVVTGGSGGTYNKNVYQLAQGIWQTIGQLEVARQSFTMGMLDDKLLAIGGWNGEYLDSIEEMQEDGSFRLSKLKLSTKISDQATTAIPRDMFNC